MRIDSHIQPQAAGSGLVRPDEWRPPLMVGLMITLLATGVAMVLVPVEVQPAGALMLPALVLATTLLLIPFLTVWSAPTSMFHPVLIVAVSPIYWVMLDAIQGAYDLKGVRRVDVQLAFASIGVFSAAVWIGGIGRPWRLPLAVKRAAQTRLSSQQLFLIAIAAFLLAFARFAIPARLDVGLMWQAFHTSRWGAVWGRGAFGGWDAFLDHFGYFGYVLPAITVLLVRRGGWRDGRAWICGGFAAIILALSSTGGGRRIVGVMVCIAIIVWFLSARQRRMTHVLTTILVAAGLLLTLQQILVYRGKGIATAFTAATREDQGPKYIHVDDNFLRLCQIVQVIPEQHPYVTWRWVLWVAVRPVPRVFWPDKPLNPGFDLAKHLGKRGVSLSMSLLGEAYMAFGLVGVGACGWLLGRVAASLACLAETHRGPGALILFGAGTMALFAGMRSGIELVLMSYVLLAWIALVWLYQLLSGRETRVRRRLPYPLHPVTPHPLGMPPDSDLNSSAECDVRAPENN